MSRAEQFLMSLIGRAIEVRDDGTIWRIAQRGRTGNWRTISPTRADELRPDGYRQVRVQVEGRAYSALAHRLMWRTYMGPIPGCLEPNHKNGDRGNNSLSNLELLTKGENLQHSYRVLGRPRPSGERNGRAVLTGTQVAKIRARVASGESQRSVARAFGVTHRTIGKIARGEAWRDEYPAVTG